MGINDYPSIGIKNQTAYRLINSKYPPKSLFDDVASEEEFDAVYAVQMLTNPRILNDLGDLNLLPSAEIPFGISGCNYATAPFTHTNPDGSRFSDGSFGVLYLASDIETAIAETAHHQALTFKKITGLHYDRIKMRCLTFTFCAKAADLSKAEAKIYNPNDYSYSRIIGLEAKKERMDGLQFNSVRNSGATCWALLTPSGVSRAVQNAHYEYIWNGHCISEINQLTNVR